MNNNTFEDPLWLKTFEEVWEKGLIWKDSNGFDARLINAEKAEALAKTKFEGQIHCAWDFMENEAAILRGITAMIDAGIRPIIISCYVLVGYKTAGGYNTTEEEDIYRIRRLRELGVLPFVMPFNKSALIKERHYAKEFFRNATRPAIIKAIDWNKVKTWKDVRRVA